MIRSEGQIRSWRRLKSGFRIKRCVQYKMKKKHTHIQHTQSALLWIHSDKPPLWCCRGEELQYVTGTRAEVWRPWGVGELHLEYRLQEQQSIKQQFPELISNLNKENHRITTVSACSIKATNLVSRVRHVQLHMYRIQVCIWVCWTIWIQVMSDSKMNYYRHKHTKKVKVSPASQTDDRRLRALIREKVVVIGSPVEWAPCKLIESCVSLRKDCVRIGSDVWTKKQWNFQNKTHMKP